ncbi:hypothetical protein [Marinoscillum pacificum]|uniref:hypothetical protein n=1 Tax=Marinoscillum pacificum TaxID=392723 RepID=UPI00215792FB|nr:hypothetical protein [Marinoscillum pacificum]
MTVNKNLSLGLLCAALFACSPATQPAPDYINEQWAKDQLWDDGQAEVAIYDAERVVYGKTRKFEYVYVLVKEEFNQEFRVKTDDYNRSDLYPVMKVNKFCRIETLKYPYHYLTSVFYKRESPHQVHKLTNTSQEWCGNTAKSFLENGNQYDFQYMSYWDGQGNGTTTIEKGPWFEDQLSYTLRTLDFEEGLQFEVDLYPMQVSSKASVPVSEKATIAIEKASMNELTEIDSDLINEPWKVSVTRTEGSNLTYWINDVYPNILLKMEATDGRKLSLKSLTRDAYWNHE